MNRRNFLGLIGGVAAGAAVRTWPFRVFSFPGEVQKFDLLQMPEIPVELRGYHFDVIIADDLVADENVLRIPAIIGEWSNYYHRNFLTPTELGRTTKA